MTLVYAEEDGGRRTEEGPEIPPRASRLAPREFVNALSIDVEDWFCVANLSGVIDRDKWDACELRVEQSAGRVLQLLDRHGAKATFFVLGWVADRVPGLIRDIERQGHEIASHGYGHQLLTTLTPDEFEADLVRSTEALRRTGIVSDVIGYRAPSFTIVERTKWALPILEKHGFKYDSSMMPIGFHPDYGIPDGPTEPCKLTDGLYEFPLTCVDLFGKRVPCSGGGYFRLLPYRFTRIGLRHCNEQGRPAIFYFHPWELDPGQPRVKLPLTKRIRHYYGLESAERKLNRLLTDFRFTAIRDVLAL